MKLGDGISAITRSTCGLNNAAELEIRWYMNRDFCLALLRNWKTNEPAKVIDFTRYDLKAEEPKGPDRNFSLINRINQKGIRPQDKPRLFTELQPEDQALIRQELTNG